ncbi:NAD(P)-binding domain-containing protein [Streptomyces sp. NPDC059080]|uniref:NAD(P)-binding domain-containing protein n=1 Tax=Streptomyces sp. NPDC059080 TaxID=3346718 RepID=UPI0036B57B02
MRGARRVSGALPGASSAGPFPVGVDAPVSGGEAGAVEGVLSIMVGGTALVVGRGPAHTHRVGFARARQVSRARAVNRFARGLGSRRPGVQVGPGPTGFGRGAPGCRTRRIRPGQAVRGRRRQLRARNPRAAVTNAARAAAYVSHAPSGTASTRCSARR